MLIFYWLFLDVNMIFVLFFNILCNLYKCFLFYVSLFYVFMLFVMVFFDLLSDVVIFMCVFVCYF